MMVFVYILTKTEEIIQTLNGVTVQANINDYSQNNQNVMNISTEEWISKLLEEKDKHLQEKTEIIEQQQAALLDKDMTINTLNEIVRTLSLQFKK